MKFRDHSKTKRAEMQLAPMIDVVFLLLIFFIVSWNFARFETEETVVVPEAETSEQTSRVPGEIVINVTESGQIKVSNEVVAVEELFQQLSGLVAKFPDQPVILRGHKTVPFKYVMAVLDTCQQAGVWNVAFAAEKPAENSAEPTALP